MDRDSIDTVDVSEEIAAFKRSLAGRRDVLKRAYDDVRAHVGRTADAIQAAVAAGKPVVPEVEFRTIRDGQVPEATRVAIRRTGCVVVRGVFPVSVASAWFDELGAYLETNRYEEREVEKRSLDLYFSALKAGRPQIFNVYWSKPQVNARQDPKLAETRAFLNRLWRYAGVFDPDRECTYADRVRRRQPGDETLGLSPHMDAGTVERWIDPGFQRVYGDVFAGNWRAYDPFDGAHRLDTREIPSPAVCSMFRTYQGWTALTRQGPQDGTLRLIPIAEGICYVLLRAMQEDVADTDLCGAAPGRALGVSAEWHPDLMAGLVSIPEVQPGDTVFWHTDICHAVADKHAGSEYASVIYIGSAPDCAKNRAYLPRQQEAFLAGRSAPDFAPMDFEVDFVGRATEEDLTSLGRAQMGF
ncbi:MAG TPA: YbiU family protein [Vicinamibacterales bacterium]|nr:YbiU family protein [Vicinamibacterales bacterium]